MASTYTDSNGIEKPGTGEQSGTWGDTVNTNMDLLDEAMDGAVSFTVPAAGSSGSPNAFIIADGSTAPARHRFVTFVDSADLGSTAYVQLTPNNAAKIYIAKNSLRANRALVLFQGTYNAGRAVQINSGETYLISFDGAGASATCTKIGEIAEAVGTIASQDSNDVALTGGTIAGVTGSFPTMTSPNVTITGGTITGITDLTVADGGTGASTAAGARSNLGLAIGSDVQAYDANLGQIAALTPTDSNFIVGNGSAWVAEGAATALTSLGITATAAEINNLDGITPAGAALLDDADAAAQRTTLGASSTGDAIFTAADADTVTALLTETGTFTPTFSDNDNAAGNQGTSYSSQYGQYLRIGDLCYILIRMSGADLSALTSSNSLYVVGLPFWAYDQNRGSYQRPQIPSFCRNMDPGGFFYISDYSLGLDTYASGYFQTPLSAGVGASTVQVSELTGITSVSVDITGVYRIDTTNIPAAYSP